MQDDSPGHPIDQYIATASGEGAMSAAQGLSDVLGVGLDEVLAALQELGKWASATSRVGRESTTVGGPVASVRVSAGISERTAWICPVPARPGADFYLQPVPRSTAVEPQCRGPSFVEPASQYLLVRSLSPAGMALE
jgi:hypothetical protein